ncbi:MAG: helix-turn-helix transcriptional regulator [Deltaproteobacteria bacterium]|nr:helix-turn-helix transcriptional regulator [Deltaproteobacteria bacterium]
MKAIKFNPNSLKSLRNKERLSVYQFARRLGTTSQRVYLWENGSTQPNMKALERICNTFKVKPSYFFLNVLINILIDLSSSVLILFSATQDVAST